MSGSTPPVLQSPVFFLDYDGTLAPIVDDPMRAFPHPDLPPLLGSLINDYPAWIVTGRDLRALGRLLSVRMPAVGLHGVEWGTVGEVHEERLAPPDRQAINSMRGSVPALEGVVVEEKGALFAVHYRNAPHLEHIERTLDAWSKQAPPTLEVVWGKFVVELRPRGQSKGEVVDELLERYPGRAPVYLGDDTTDEDAFRTLGGRGAGIKVGSGATEAPYRLNGVEEVVGYLRKYLSG